jgi:hypothetical protein
VIGACVLAVVLHGGGSINDTATVVRWLQDSRCTVRISGECASACTMLLAAGCVMPDARLGFHAPHRNGKPLPDGERAIFAQRMADHLPRRLARWYLDGPAHQASPVWITASEAVKAGVVSC